MTHNGKIGRLPLPIQEELNRRMENGAQGGKLLAWLNSLPEVQALVASEFGGKPVRKQNLSDWRQGGYRHWLQQQEAMAMARQLIAESGALQPSGAPPLADQLTVWLTTRYLLAIRKLQEKNPGGELDLPVLRELCRDLVAVRRGDHSAARLKIEQERLEREREKTAEEVVAQFEDWAENKEMRDLICQNWASPEERRRRMREKFGLSPDPVPDETQQKDVPPDGN